MEGAEEGRPHRQPSQVPPRPRGGLLSGLPSGTQERQTPGVQGHNHPRLASPHLQETGKVVPGVG